MTTDSVRGMLGTTGDDDEDSLDLSGFEAEDLRKTIPADDYIVKIVDVQQGYGKQSLERYWRLDLEVIKGPYAGSRLSDYGSLSWSEKARGRAKTRLLTWCEGHDIGPVNDIRLSKVRAVLLDMVMTATVTVREDGQYGKSNSVSRLAPYVGVAHAGPTERTTSKPGKAQNLLGL